MPELSQTAVRILFLGVVLLVPCQYWFATRFSEPYPALLMPRFEGTGPPAREPFRLHVVEVSVEFDSGPPASVLPLDLLAPLPDSHVMPIMERMFGSNRSDELDTAHVAADPERLPSSSRSVERWLPGLRLRRARAAEKHTSPATRAWLRQRVKALFPSRRARVVRFLWFDDSYEVRGSQSERSRVTAGVYTVHLDD